MTSFILSNIATPITYKQFEDITKHFKTAAERLFGTECYLNINALSASKRVCPSSDAELQLYAEQMNKDNTFLSTGSLEELDEAAWRRAAYIEVTARPIDNLAAPLYALAHLEFKGERPLGANFYFQPDDSGALDAFLPGGIENSHIEGASTDVMRLLPRALSHFFAPR